MAHMAVLRLKLCVKLWKAQDLYWEPMVLQKQQIVMILSNNYRHHHRCTIMAIIILKIFMRLMYSVTTLTGHHWPPTALWRRIANQGLARSSLQCWWQWGINSSLYQVVWMIDNQEKPLPLVSLADALAFCCYLHGHYLHGQTPCECWYYMNQMEMMVIMIAAVMKVMGTGFKDLQPGLWFVFCLGGWPGHTSYLPYTAWLYNEEQCVEHALLVLYSWPQATRRCTICSNI